MTHFELKMGQKWLICANLRDISEESGVRCTKKLLWWSPAIMNVKRDLRENEVQKYRIICPFSHWNCPFSNEQKNEQMDKMTLKGPWKDQNSHLHDPKRDITRSGSAPSSPIMEYPWALSLHALRTRDRKLLLFLWHHKGFIKPLEGPENSLSRKWANGAQNEALWGYSSE